MFDIDFELLDELDPQSKSHPTCEDIFATTGLDKIGRHKVQFSTLGAGVAAEMHLHADERAVEIKDRLQILLQIPSAEQKLILGATVWEDACTLEDAHNRGISIYPHGPIQVTILRVALPASSALTHVAVSGDRAGHLTVWDVANGSMLQEWNGHAGGVNCVAMHWASQRALSGGEDRLLRTWDLTLGKAIKEMKHLGVVNCVAVDWESSYALSGSGDNTLRAWNLDTGELQRRLKGHRGPVTCVAIDTVSWRAISGSEDRTLLIWDLQTGESFQECRGNTSEVQCVAFDVHSHRAASGGWGVLKLWHLKYWNFDGGFNFRNLKGHTFPVTCMSVNWRSMCCLTGSSDCTLCWWKSDDSSESGFCESPVILRRHTLPVTCLVVDWESVCAVSGGGDCLYVWDLNEGKLLHALRGTKERGQVLCVTMEPV